MTEISSILADVDPRSQERDDARLPSLERVRQLAAATGACVHLFMCDYLESLRGGVLVNAESLEQSRADYMRELQDWLEQQASSLRQDGVNVYSHIAWNPHRYEAILQKANEIDADLIIRATRKRSRINRMFFAATDWELIRRAPQLLWLVKKPLDISERGLRVLAAVDPGHPEEKKAGLDRKLVTTAEAIVKLTGGSLHIFHAYNPGVMVAPVAAASHHGAIPALRMSNELVAELENQRQNDVRTLASFADVPDDRVHIVAGSTRDALEELVAAQEIDLVVAGAVSRGRLERLLIGNTAEAILDDVACDVLVVKPDSFPRP